MPRGAEPTRNVEYKYHQELEDLWEGEDGCEADARVREVDARFRAAACGRGGTAETTFVGAVGRNGEEAVDVGGCGVEVGG